ncbi:MAG: hypothetical protein A2156_01100 [Deltaproteobacteria bacterium RBG_16_48_10]|nr:MAG: hypothetical protein A2156_01100 [Deltaproteobacteria bacterium RBG_16_48_10]
MEDLNVKAEAKSLIKQLMEKLAIKKEAERRLVNIGEPALPCIIEELIATENGTLVDRLIKVLKKIGEPSARYAIQQLKSEDEFIRGRFEEVLVDIGKSALRPLTDALKTSKPLARASIIYVFGRIADRDSFELILDALKDENDEVKSAAAEALGYFRDSRAVEPLIRVCL